MQTHRTTRHRVFRSAKETPTDIIPPPLSSLDDAYLRMDRCKIRCRWTSDSTWDDKLVHTHTYVLLLHVVGSWSRGTEVLVVEEVPYHDADNTILHNICTQFSNVIHRLRLSETVVNTVGHQCRNVHLHVRIILR